MSLNLSSNSRGIIDLQLQVDADTDDGRKSLFASMDETIRTHEVQESKNRPLIPGPQGWMCAAWILNVLYDLEGAGAWDMPVGVGSTYTRPSLNADCL